jgi:hypothetical protein
MLDLLLDFFWLDHAVNLNDQLVLHEHLDVWWRYLDHVVLRKVKLGLLLVLNHNCLLNFVIPLIEALSLISIFFIVYCRLLELDGNLKPLIQNAWVGHVFIINQVKRGFLVGIEQLKVKGNLQRARFKRLAIVDVLFFVYI